MKLGLARRPTSVWITVPGALLLLLTAALPGDVVAQEEAATAEKPAAVCWRGQPLGQCRNFLVVEMQGRVNVFSTSRTQSHPQLPDSEQRSFGNGLEWNLGLMRNVSDDWALGGTVSLGTGSTGAFTGLRGRARRWLSPSSSVELEAGVRASDMGAHWGAGTLWGPTIGARLNAGDHGSLFVRWDGVHAPAGRRERSGARIEGGFQQGLHVGASLGHTWAVAGTAVLGGLIVWIVSTMEW